MSMVGRRHFLVASGAMLASPLVRAQTRDSDRIRKIGYLSLSSLNPKFPPSGYDSTKALKKLGWIEGENVVIERRYADRKPERLPALAQELVRTRVELIVAYTGAAAVAAARATRTIPIVFFAAPAPFEQGLVDSLARPGRNATGASNYLPGVAEKIFEFLRDIAPTAKRIFQTRPLEFNVAVGGQEKILEMRRRLLENVKALGFDIRNYEIRDGRDIEAAFEAALAWGAQAFFSTPGVSIGAAHQKVAKFALQHRLPSVGANSYLVEVGGLLSYGLSRTEITALTNSAMEQVDRILRGANPADLPVVQPRTYELVINLKTARALGLTVPSSLQLQADRVIE